MTSVTPEKVIVYTWWGVALSFCWPPSPNCNKCQIIGFKCLRLMSIISAILLSLPMIYSLYLHMDDILLIAKTSVLVAATIQIIVQTTISATQYDDFQRLIEEMKFCCTYGEPHEKHVFQQYADKYGAFYGVSMSCAYLTTCIIILATLVLSEPLPTKAEYPFSVDYQPMRSLIFLHQSFVGLQCAAHVCMNIFCALLLWFAAARFEILRLELKSVSNIRILIKCIRKLQHIQKYARVVTINVRLLILVSIAMSTASLVACGVAFISKQPLAVLVQFIFLSLIALLEVYLCVWPADHLMDLSVNAVRGVYESDWYEQTEKVKHMILYLLNPQKPVIVSISIVVPALSMEYYCSYLSNTFSAFTALRVMLDSE